jgi:hypothetical protein
MIQYDPGTKTVTWEAGSEEIFQVRKVNVGTVTTPTVELYKVNNETAITSTYTSGSASVSNDGTTVILTTPKFLSTLPSGTYKLLFKGVVNSLTTVIDSLRIVVRKKSAI